MDAPLAFFLLSDAAKGDAPLVGFPLPGQIPAAGSGQWTAALQHGVPGDRGGTDHEWRGESHGLYGDVWDRHFALIAGRTGCGKDIRPGNPTTIPAPGAPPDGGDCLFADLPRSQPRHPFYQPGPGR